MGNKLVKDESTRIEPFIIQNAPNKKDLTQSGTALTLMPGKDGVGYEAVKVPKSGVTNESCFGSTSTIGSLAHMIVINLSTLLTYNLTPKGLYITVLMPNSLNPTVRQTQTPVKLM